MRLLEVVFRLTGRLFAACLGLVLAAAGLALTLTVIGAFLGVPMLLFGLMLCVRALV